ncbi:Uncharacterised protein [uncultured Eubacterium sp.]|nr:Uncharacterised protein [uncultured Eubacterium sp.]
MKKISVLLLSILLIVTCMPTLIWADISTNLEGEGTRESPYLITSVNDLKNFAEKVKDGDSFNGKFVKLTKDLDLNNEPWNPIENGSNPKSNMFAGTFDGGDKIIKNLYINCPERINVGFFGATDYTATIKNLNFVNADVTGLESVAVVVGGKQGTIEKVSVSGNIKVEALTAEKHSRAGVIAGGWCYGDFINCKVKGDSSSYVKGKGRYCGGLLGHPDDVNKYTNCTVENINIEGEWLCGGLAGAGPARSTVNGCSVEGVKINAYASGGLFGWFSSWEGTPGTIANVKLKDIAFIGRQDRNGIVGGYAMNDTVSVINLTVDNVKGESGANLITYDAKSKLNDGSERHYSTLDTAVKNVDNNATVTLLADNKTTAVIPANKTVNIECNGKDLGDIRAADGCLLNVSEIAKGIVRFTTSEQLDGEAIVNGVSAATLSEAIGLANPGETITLLRDVTVNEQICISKNITLDLNHKMVTGAVPVITSPSKIITAPISIEAGCDVKIINGTIKSTIDDDWASALVVRDGAAAEIEKISFENSKKGCGIYAYGTVTILDSKVNTKNSGISCQGKCDVKIKNTNVISSVGNCIGTSTAGSPEMKVEIDGGIFESKGTSWDGGSIYWASHGNLIIKAGDFKATAENTAATALYQKNGEIDISGGSFSGKDGLKLGAEAADSTEICLNISGGSYKGSRSGLYLKTTGNGNNCTKYDIGITGGAFRGEETCIFQSLDAKVIEPAVKISGGTFTTGEEKYDVKEYLQSGYRQDNNGKVDREYIPTPVPDNVINHPVDKTTTADVETSTGADGKATATVDKTTADKIVDKAVANESKEIVIDATTTKADAKTAEVKLPAETVKAIVEKTAADVVVKTDAAEVVLDQKAAEAVAEKATTGTVSIVVEKVKEDDSQVQVELKIITENGNVTDFKGGNAKVTVALPTALRDKDVVCVYIEEDGNYAKMEGKKNADGTYTFTTGHFSTYAVMTAEEADKVIAEQEKAKNDQIKAGVKATTIKASSTAKKGSITIKWKKSNGFKVDYFQVFRSTKKNSGYGTKAFYTTKSGTQKSYKNTKALKKGTRYYYKVRGLRTIDGVKVYTKWSSKAIRTAK